MTFSAIGNCSKASSSCCWIASALYLELAILLQVLTDLLSNVIKIVALATQAQVRVRAEVLAEFDGKYIYLWIEDNGSGIVPQVR